MPLLPLLVASVLLGVACRREASEANVYNEMLRASRERAMFVGNEFAVDEAHAMLDRAEREGSRYGKVMAYLSLSSLAAQSGDHDDLRRYMEVARASLDVADPPYLQGYAYYVEGTVDFSTTLSINALLCYDKALRYFRPLGDSLMVASCFVNKCNCYMVNKNLEGSSACLDSAKAWCPVSYGHTTRFYEAMLQSYLGQPQQAMQTYADIVAAARADSASFAFPSRASARFWALLYSNYIFSALASDSIALAEGILQEMRLLASATAPTPKAKSTSLSVATWSMGLIFCALPTAVPLSVAGATTCLSTVACTISIWLVPPPPTFPRRSTSRPISLPSFVRSTPSCWSTIPCASSWLTTPVPPRASVRRPRVPSRSPSFPTPQVAG